MKRNSKDFIHQAIKFGIVGISNTLLTAIVIWICLKLFHLNDTFSNVIGYTIGLINSFIWNKKWTFSSDGKVSVTFLKFLFVFAISYILQFGVLQFLLKFAGTNNYVCHLLAMILYTVINFILNKVFTFKKI